MNQVSIYEKASSSQVSMYSNETWTRLGVDMSGVGVAVGQRDMRRVVDFATVLVDKLM